MATTSDSKPENPQTALEGWKTSELFLEKDSEKNWQGMLRGIVHGAPYYPTQGAVCEKDPTHQAPEETCVCGYYARKTQKQAVMDIYRTWGISLPAILQTVPYGTIYEGEQGYISSFQQLQTMILDPRCDVDGCVNMGNICTEHANLFPHKYRIRVCCTEHQNTDQQPLTLSELAGAYQCEIQWADLKQWRKWEQERVMLETEAKQKNLHRRLSAEKLFKQTRKKYRQKTYMLELGVAIIAVGVVSGILSPAILAFVSGIGLSTTSWWTWKKRRTLQQPNENLFIWANAIYIAGLTGGLLLWWML